MQSICYFGLLLACFNFVCLTHGQDIVFSDTQELDNCTTSSGQMGKCKDMRECPLFKKGSQLTEEPVICSFDRSNPIVCCPITLDLLTQNDTNQLLSRNGVESPPTDFQCGLRNSLQGERFVREADFSITVVGGILSAKNSWPWMALLGRKKDASNFFFCDGVLINRKFVLTAAHCFVEQSPFFVRLGEHDTSINVPEGPNAPTDYGVKKLNFHPKYDPSLGYNDLAVIELTTGITFFTISVKPICIPWGNSAFENLINRRVTLAGWGAEQYGGKPSSVLREAELTIFDPSVCKKSYSTLRDFKSLFPEGMTKENVICAGDLQGKDACQGDSGGPLVYLQPDGSYLLVGIVSKGYGCGKPDFPGIYAPVQSISTLQWIKDTAF